MAKLRKDVHVNGDGAAERRKLNQRSVFARVRRLLREGGDTSSYQVLCFNCNIAKHLLGACSCSETHLKEVI